MRSSPRQRPDSGVVDFSDTRVELKIAEFWEVAELHAIDDVDNLVLVRKGLVRFPEADHWESLVEEWFVVASAQLETIWSENGVHCDPSSTISSSSH
jgi:hypothetical protein